MTRSQKRRNEYYSSCLINRHKLFTKTKCNNYQNNKYFNHTISTAMCIKKLKTGKLQGSLQM